MIDSHDFRSGDELRDECGVFGVYSAGGPSASGNPAKGAGGPSAPLNVAEVCYYGLYALQHRGQESAGIAAADGQRIACHREMGLVPEVFSPEKLERLTGFAAIGHVRYSTSGHADVINTQPLVIQYKKGALSLAHNGELVNGDRLRDELEDGGAIFQTTVDTEVMASLIARMSDEGIETAVQRMMAAVRGSYALVMLTESQLIGVRDPMGIRPLCLGQIGDSYVLASESCAFDAVGASFIRDVKPGEIIVIDQGGLRSIQTPSPTASSLCVFEFVYFARTDSTIDGIGVYAARLAAGKRLAMRYPVDADMVIGVPDSAITAALGYAEQSGIPYGEGLAKNRYVGRTFIQPEQNMREIGVRTKLNALTRNVRGKRIVMVDDSIVRGTTSRKIVDMLRMAGAREVHMRISSPPVMFPCHFGIDTPSAGELIATQYSIEQMRRIIGADSLEFLSLEDLLKTVEGSGCGFCEGCFSGKYPMDKEA